MNVQISRDVELRAISRSLTLEQSTDGSPSDNHPITHLLRSLKIIMFREPIFEGYWLSQGLPCCFLSRLHPKLWKWRCVFVHRWPQRSNPGFTENRIPLLLFASSAPRTTDFLERLASTRTLMTAGLAHGASSNVFVVVTKTPLGSLWAASVAVVQQLGLHRLSRLSRLRLSRLGPIFYIICI